MRRVKLFALAALAMFAFAAISAVAASAAEPAILCLVEGCGALKVTATGGASSLETLGGLTLTGQTTTATITGCEETASKKDITKCKDQDILFTGVAKGAQLCSTEGLSAEKGEVLALLDITAAAEETSAKVLEPLLVFKVLNSKLEAKLLIKCGVAKVEVKGNIGCLALPGLTNIATTGSVEVKCALNKATHDPETGKCVTPAVACEALTKEPFESKLGEKFEDAWMEISVKGSPSKDIFIED